MQKLDSSTLEQELRALIAEIVEIEPERITRDASFVEDLGMDSMMALEILASIEKRYKLKISDDKLTKIANLNQVITLVSEYLQK